MTSSNEAGYFQMQSELQNISHGSHQNQPSELPAFSSVTTSGSFQRRTFEGARQIRDNISNVIREIQPFLENVDMGPQLSSMLNRPSLSPDVGPSRQVTPQENSFVINIDGFTTQQPINIEVQANNASHTHPVTNSSNNEDNNVNDEINAERLQATVEGQQILKVILLYIPFFLILLAKSVYDYYQSILIILVLLFTFAHANYTVKKEATKRQRRSFYALGVELLYIAACLLLIHFIFDDEVHNFNDVLNLVLIRTFSHPLTVWNLLWIVTVTDFVLKLITVSIKILLTMLPGGLLAFQKRGKIYLYIEAMSQLYRSMAAVQPWLYYLLESYQGPEKIVAVILCAFYMISKGPDLMAKLKLLKRAFFKLLQQVAIGSSPSKEQIQTAGEHCPICHDEYEAPVLLQCRHIFCENCVTTWFDREQTCPLCRAKIVDDPSWRDGSTSAFFQIF